VAVRARRSVNLSRIHHAMIGNWRLAIDYWLLTIGY
jgi:hypothetical protein